MRDEGIRSGRRLVVPREDEQMDECDYDGHYFDTRFTWERVKIMCIKPRCSPT